MQFKGYEGEQIESEVTGFQRLKYNRDEPFTKEVTYYNNFKPTQQVEIPKGYIIPQGWWNVLELLEANQVEMQVYKKDTMLQAEAYRITDYQTRNSPYEGHYLHYDTQVEKSTTEINIRKGDVFVPTDQPAIKYLLETLEPEASDSFFNWNFFDSILQQKEGFSPYVFEDIAEELLEDYPEIEEEFIQKKQNDSEFAASWYAQLEWLHKQSDHYEKAHLRYPVFRVAR